MMLDHYSQFCLRPPQLSPTALVNPPGEAHHAGAGMMGMTPNMGPIASMALHLQQVAANSIMPSQPPGVPYPGQQLAQQVSPGAIHATPPAQMHAMSTDGLLSGFSQHQPMMTNHQQPPGQVHFPTSSPNQIQHASSSHSIPPPMSSPFQAPAMQMSVTSSNQLPQGFPYQGQHGQALLPQAVSNPNLMSDTLYSMQSNIMSFGQNQLSQNVLQSNLPNGHQARPANVVPSDRNQGIQQRQYPPKNIHPAFNLALRQQRPRMDIQMRMPRPQVNQSSQPINIMPLADARARPPPPYPRNSNQGLQPRQTPQGGHDQRQRPVLPQSSATYQSNQSENRSHSKRVKPVNYGMIVLDSDAPAKPVRRSNARPEYIDLDDVTSLDDSRKYKPPEESACIVIAPQPDFEEENRRSNSRSRNSDKRKDVSPIVRDVVSEILNKHPVQRAKSPDIRTQIANGADTRAIAQDIVSTIMARHAKEASENQVEKERPITINSSAEDIVKQVMAKHCKEFPPSRKQSSDGERQNDSSQTIRSNVPDQASGSTHRNKSNPNSRNSSACPTPDNAHSQSPNSNLGPSTIRRNSSNMGSRNPSACPTPENTRSPLSNNVTRVNSPMHTNSNHSESRPNSGLSDAESLVNDILARHKISVERRNSNVATEPVVSNQLNDPGLEKSQAESDTSGRVESSAALTVTDQGQQGLSASQSSVSVMMNVQSVPQNPNIQMDLQQEKTASVTASQVGPITTAVQAVGAQNGNVQPSENVPSGNSRTMETGPVTVIQPIDDNTLTTTSSSQAAGASPIATLNPQGGTHSNQTDQACPSKSTTDHIVDQILALRADKPVDTESIVDGIIALSAQRAAESTDLSNSLSGSSSSKDVVTERSARESNKMDDVNNEAIRESQGDSTVVQAMETCASELSDVNGTDDTAVSVSVSTASGTVAGAGHDQANDSSATASTLETMITSPLVTGGDAPPVNEIVPESSTCTLLTSSRSLDMMRSAELQMMTRSTSSETGCSDPPAAASDTAACSDVNLSNAAESTDNALQTESGASETQQVGAPCDASVHSIESTVANASEVRTGTDDQTSNLVSTKDTSKEGANSISLSDAEQAHQQKDVCGDSLSTDASVVSKDVPNENITPVTTSTSMNITSGTAAPVMPAKGRTPPPPLLPIANLPPLPTSEVQLPPHLGPPNLLPFLAVSSQPPPLQPFITTASNLLRLPPPSRPVWLSGLPVLGQPPPLRPLDSQQVGGQLLPQHIIDPRLQFLKFNIPRPPHLMSPHLRPITPKLEGGGHMPWLPQQAPLLLQGVPPRPVLQNTCFQVNPAFRPPTLVDNSPGQPMPPVPPLQPVPDSQPNMPSQETVSPDVPAPLPVAKQPPRRPSSGSVTSSVSTAASRAADPVKPKGLSKNPRLPISKTRLAQYERIAKKHVTRLTKFYRSRRQFLRKIKISNHRVPTVLQPVVMMKRLSPVKIVCNCDTEFDERVIPRGKRGQKNSPDQVETRTEPPSPSESNPSEESELKGNPSAAATDEQEDGISDGNKANSGVDSADDAKVSAAGNKTRKRLRLGDRSKEEPQKKAVQSKSQKSKRKKPRTSSGSDDDGDEEWTMAKERSRRNSQSRRGVSRRNDSDSDSSPRRRKVNRRKRKRANDSGSDEDWTIKQPSRKRRRKIKFAQSDDSAEEPLPRRSRKGRRSAAYLASYSEDDDYRPKRGRKDEDDDDWLVDSATSSEYSCSSSESDVSDSCNLSDSDDRNSRKKYRKRAVKTSSSSEDSDSESKWRKGQKKSRSRKQESNHGKGSRIKRRPKKYSVDSSSSDEETDIESNQVPDKEEETAADKTDHTGDPTPKGKQESDANQNLISNKENTKPCPDSIESFLDQNEPKLPGVTETAKAVVVNGVHDAHIPSGPQPEFVSLDDLMKCGMLPPLIDDDADRPVVPLGDAESFSHPQPKLRSHSDASATMNSRNDSAATGRADESLGAGQVVSGTPTHVLQELVSGAINSNVLRDCKPAAEEKSLNTCLPVVST